MDQLQNNSSVSLPVYYSLSGVSREGHDLGIVTDSVKFTNTMITGDGDGDGGDNGNDNTEKTDAKKHAEFNKAANSATVKLVSAYNAEISFPTIGFI